MVEPIEILFSNVSSIPLEITQTTNPYQFYLALILGSFAIFWVIGNVLGMKIKEGYAMLNLIYFRLKYKSNHLMIIKHTQNELFNPSMINQSTLRRVQDALIDFKGKPFDLILYTPGGEIFSATYISRMFKNYPGKIRSFIPVYSMSGGTFLALSTDEIYMNENSCLGAVDPQLGNLFKFGSARSWKEVLKVKKNKAEDSSISFKFIGEQYTKSMKESIRELLKGKVLQKDMNKIVNLLVSGDIEHGFNLTKDILRAYGLPIKNIGPKTNNYLHKLIKHLPEGVSYA